MRVLALTKFDSLSGDMGDGIFSFGFKKWKINGKLNSDMLLS